MTKATKEALKKDARVAALQKRITESGVKMSASESKNVAEGLINKYGDKAEELTVNCLVRPYEMRDALGMKGQCTSKSMLNYFNKEIRTNDAVTKALGKEQSNKSPNNNKDTSARSDTKASMKKVAVVAKDKVANAKNNIGNYDWAGNQTQAWKPKDIKAAPTNTATTTAKKTTVKGPAEKLEAYDWAANQPKGWKPKDIKAAPTNTATTTAKKTTVKKPAEKLEAYDWAANQPKGWQPKDIKAAPAKTAVVTKTTTQNQVAQNTAKANVTAPKTGTAKKNEEKFGSTFKWENNMEEIRNRNLPKPLTAEEKLEKAKGDKGYITFDDLKQAGIDVTSQDMRAIINKQKTLDDKAKIITSITPGKKSQDLADWMTRHTSGKPNGDCLSGPQNGMVGGVYHSDEASPLYARSDAWDEFKYKGKKSNSACDSHKVLEKHGDWFAVDIKNSAYHDPSKNNEMRAFNNKMRSGTYLNVDNLEIEGSRGADDNNKPKFENGTQSAIHGHTWVKDNKGRNCCDGIQMAGDIDFSRYGKEMHVTLSTDSRIPDDLAKQLIEESEKRKKQYSMLLDNVRDAR